MLLITTCSFSISEHLIKTKVYWTYIQIFDCILGGTMSSSAWITASSRNLDVGDPIGVLLIPFYRSPSNLKYVHLSVRKLLIFPMNCQSDIFENFQSELQNKPTFTICLSLSSSEPNYCKPSNSYSPNFRKNNYDRFSKDFLSQLSAFEFIPLILRSLVNLEIWFGCVVH